MRTDSNHHQTPDYASKDSKKALITGNHVRFQLQGTSMYTNKAQDTLIQYVLASDSRGLFIFHYRECPRICCSVVVAGESKALANCLT